MIKDIDITKTEIVESQQREISYKGKLNRDLYLIGISATEQIIGRIHWKNTNVTTYNEFLNLCESHPQIIRAYVSNAFFDWTVDIYTQ